MYNYNELFQTCDNILNLFTTARPRLSDTDIASSIQDNKSLIRSALQELITHDCIKEDEASSGHWYLLKGKGTQIREMGGFKEYFKELKRKDEIKEILDQYSIDTSKSVIKTNNIVQDNVRSQERLTKLTLTVAAASVIVSIIALVKPQQLIDTETRQTLKTQVQVLDSLKQSFDSVRYQLKIQKSFSNQINTAKQKDTTHKLQ